MKKEEILDFLDSMLGYFGKLSVVGANIIRIKETISNLGWHNAQGDYLPDYGREVIVLEKVEGGSFRVSFGHRPNPKEYVVIEGKKYFAKTYDKGNWNLPNLTYWLDIELPKGVE